MSVRKACWCSCVNVAREVFGYFECCCDSLVILAPALVGSSAFTDGLTAVANVQDG